MIAAARRGGMRWKEGGRAPSQMTEQGDAGRVQVVWGVGMKRPGRGGDVWQWEVKERPRAAKLDPQGFGICTAYTQTHRLTYISESLDCARGREEDVETPSSAAQPAATNSSAAPANNGLMPSGGLWAEPLHYPEMGESIRSNYIKHTEISPLFLWKQMWVILHKSTPSVKYSCTCDVSLSNVNTCITAAIDMMWWTGRNRIPSRHFITHVVHCG